MDAQLHKMPRNIQPEPVMGNKDRRKEKKKPKQPKDKPKTAPGKPGAITFPK